jgi:hypothetical protein
MSIKIIGRMKKTAFRLQQNYILKHKIALLGDIETILNVGSFPFEEDKEKSQYKDYFKNKQYYTLDNSKGDYGTFHFNVDLHDLSTIDKKFDIVLCMSVLEHVKNPFVVVEQLKKISNKYIFLVVPFMVPLHHKKKKGLIDYWRFTNEGLRELFWDCDEVWMEKINSVIIKVKDKKAGWNEENTKVGYASLYRKKT